MLSVLVWFAMWGQAQTPDLSRLTDPGIVRPLKTGPHVPWDQDPAMLGDSHASPKPAEHVIEIKTISSASTRTADGKCPHGFSEPYCQRVTRELWIDGVKFGIIKGLD